MSAGVISGNVFHIEVRDVTVDLGSVAANTSAETDVSVSGLLAEDWVWVNKPSLEAGLAIGNVRVKSEGTLSVQAINTTAAAIDEVSETFKLLIVRPE